MYLQVNYSVNRFHEIFLFYFSQYFDHFRKARYNHEFYYFAILAMMESAYYNAIPVPYFWQPSVQS